VLDREGDPYLSTDRVHFGSSCLGRGEVLIRGEAVSSGYYSNKSLTTSDFDEEGWFHTGDVGVWNAPSGELKIVDRLKNLLKLKGGDYVALESMESTFNQSAFVNVRNGGVMCYADAEMDHPIALVQVFLNARLSHLLLLLLHFITPLDFFALKLI
jgi:long-chain acyl-CoA synthetase